LGGKGISLLTLALFLTIPPVQADTSPCNGFMSLGLHNTTYRSDPGQARALVLSQFCSADFTTITDPATYQTGTVGNIKVMEIEASYDVLTGSFSSAASPSNPAFAIARRNSIIQKQAELCTSKFNGEEYLKKVTDDAKNTWSDALSAWNDCNVMNNDGVKFSLKPSPNLQAVTVNLSSPLVNGGHTFNGVTQEGGNASCTTQLAPRNSSSINGKLITVDASTRIQLSNAITSITCKREMLDDGMGTNSKAAEATGLHFNTSAGSVVVPLAAIGKVPRVEYDKAVADVKGLAIPITNTIAEMQTNINTLTSALDTKATVSDISTLSRVVTDLKNQLDTVSKQAFCSGAVGDVKYSLLNPTQFAAINGGCWLPLDGRPLPEAYSLRQITGMTNLPNAGGIFIRTQEFSNSPDNDPDRTTTSPIATIQSDEIRKHRHSITDPGHIHGYSDRVNHGEISDDADDRLVGSDEAFDFGRTTAVATTGITINDTGGNETRPINMNFWIYVRVK
jgi:hypothetical protein